MSADERIAELIGGSGSALLRLAYQLCHDQSTAQDIVQEVLLKVWRHADRGHHIDDPASYARRAVVNEFLRRRRLRASTERLSPTLDDTPSQVCGEAVIDQRDEIWRAMLVLPARQRAAVVLRYYEGMSDARIAAVLGCKEGTVRSLLSRALHTLRTSPLGAQMAQGHF